MYEKHYNFKEKPFNTTPDSKFFFPSAKHAEALNSLIYAISERKGFVVVIGEIGAGKTTVCRTLLNKLDAETKIAVITNTHLSAKELICAILEEFGIEHTGGTKQKLLSLLNAFLIKELAEGVNVVLIIDEAQNLTPSVLEEVRMLSNLETEKEKLIQIILMGQPQLKKKLQTPRLEQFRQRIAVHYHLTPLNMQETKDYIYHRLKLVSENGCDIFSPSAIELIHSHSSGIPRVINLMCDSALLSGYIYDTRIITNTIIEEVIRERCTFTASQSQESPAAEMLPPVQPEVKTMCCAECQKFADCVVKWERGIKGEAQICCDKCLHYKECLAGVKKVKSN